MHRRDLARASQMTRLVQVLAVQQRQELGMLQVVVPGERDQALHSLARVQVAQAQARFGAPDMLVARLENREKKRLLVAVVVVQHAFVGAGALGDAVYSRPAEPEAREFAGRSAQDAILVALRVAPVVARRCVTHWSRRCP